jgi:hypothetical protein
LTANCIFVQYIVLLFSFINAVSKCSIGCESRDITRSIAMFLYLHIINEGIPQYTYPITIFPCIICAYWCLTHIVLCFLFCFVCLRLVTCIWWCPTHIMLCFFSICLRIVYPMLPISLDCPFLIAPSVSLTIIPSLLT